MSQFNLVKDSANIVITGNFNPSIFHPLWFSKHNLLPERHCDAADIEVIHKEVAHMKIDWLNLQVTHDRAMFSTSDATQFEQLRDLVVSVLNILDETPLTQFGVNREMEFKFEETSDWHKIGHTLAPKEVWMNSIADTKEKDCGLNKLVIQIRHDTDFPATIMNLTISPTKMNHVHFGVNNHFELKGILDKDPEFDISTFMQEHWESIILKSHDTVLNAVIHILSED